MKIKLLLVLSALSVSSLMYGQGSQRGVLYNKGKMSVIGQDTTKAILYIKGDFIAASDADDSGAKCDILMKNSRVVLTNDFRNNVKNGKVFSRPSSVGEEGVFEFRSSVPQTITTNQGTINDSPSKESSYIDFPHVTINNDNHVTVTPQIAMKTKNINLAEGWLILQSRRTNDDDYLANKYQPTKLDSLINTRSVSAHLFVDGKINYNVPNGETDLNKYGSVQVDLALDQFNTTYGYKSLVGFGTPFQSMKADYFMWNFLLAPIHGNFLGETGKTIIDPNYTLTAGRGHVVGIDLRGSDPSYYQDMSPSFSQIKFDQRATDGYYFNRFKFATDDARKDNQVFGTNPTADAYKMEKIVNDDVTVRLRPGFNYLSNPFLAPLDVTDLLGTNIAEANWGVKADAYGTDRDIVNRVWVMNGDASAKSYTQGSEWIEFNYKYYVAKKQGGTYLDEDGNVTIAPLQMFVVYAERECNLTIPANKRKMGNTYFIRNTPEERKDDFVFEVFDETTLTSDRTNIVLREQYEIDHNRECENVNRLANTSNENSNSVITEDGIPQTISSQLYTKSDDNTPRSVLFLPLETTDKRTMYMVPSSTSQNIIIRGLRLNSMSEVKEIVLEDRKTNTETLLTENTLYTTTTEPTDKLDRFVLHFRNTVGIDDEQKDEQKDIFAYYADGALNVKGFENADFGSKIFLYDIQGRILKNVVVDNNEMVIPATLTSGSYIVKVSGNKSYFTKFLVK